MSDAIAEPVRADAPSGKPDLQGLPGLTAALTRWMGASEAGFLDIGERLRGIHARVSAVRTGIDRSTELMATPDMADMRAALATAMERSDVLARLTGERGATLASIEGAIDGAAAGSAAVGTVFRTLDYVVLVARMQIAAAPGREDLMVFARHVDELVEWGAGVARDIDERTRRLHGTLGRSHAMEIEADAADAGTSLADEFRRLAERVERQQAVSGEDRREAQAVFTAVWSAVAGAVMDLQVHDSVRQRFEHTAHHLSLAQAVAADGDLGDGGAPLPAVRRTAAVRRILGLEIAQLDDLAETYEARMAALKADMAAIAGRLQACEEMLGRLRPGEGGGTGLGALDLHASGLRVRFRNGRLARDRLGAGLARSAEAASPLIEMTGRLADLEHDLHLAGLNAAVQAARVAGGDATIGYVAGVIREQAALAGDGAAAVRGGIRSAMEAMDRLTTRILPSIAGMERSIEDGLGAAAAVLSRAEAESRRALEDGAAAARGLGEDAMAVRAMIVPQEGGDGMRALSAALAALSAGLAEGSLAPGDAERLDRRLVAAYTMEEERRVFVRSTGPLPDHSNSPESSLKEESEDSADDLDGILF